MFLQREPLAARIAETKLQLSGRRNRAIGEIAARLGARARRQRFHEVRGRHFHHVVQGAAALLVARGIGRHRRQREPRHRRQTLDGFGKADAIGLHHETDDVAVLAGREVVIEALLVVHREGR